MKKRDFDFLVLTLFFVVLIFVFIFTAYNPFFQKITVFSTGLGYFIWSVFHHKRQGDLNLRVILEYLLFAGFGTAVVIFVLSGK